MSPVYFYARAAAHTGAAVSNDEEGENSCTKAQLSQTAQTHSAIFAGRDRLVGFSRHHCFYVGSGRTVGRLRNDHHQSEVPAEAGL
jgi:hypothetical protein